MAKIKKIPKNLRQYFWDVDVDKLDPSQKANFVIQRLLDKGNVEAVRWVNKHYTSSQIKKCFISLRDFREKVGNFWSLYLDIPKEKVICLQKPYLTMRKMHWPY